MTQSFRRARTYGVGRSRRSGLLLYCSKHAAHEAGPRQVGDCSPAFQRLLPVRASFNDLNSTAKVAPFSLAHPPGRRSMVTQQKSRRYASALACIRRRRSSEACC